MTVVAERKTTDGTGEFAGTLTDSPFTDVMTSPDSMPGFGGRTVGLRFHHQRAFRFLHTKTVGDILRHRLYLNADPAAADGSLVLELGDHVLHGRSRDREGDTDAFARGGIDGGVHTDDLAHAS